MAANNLQHTAPHNFQICHQQHQFKYGNILWYDYLVHWEATAGYSRLRDNGYARNTKRYCLKLRFLRCPRRRNIVGKSEATPWHSNPCGDGVEYIHSDPASRRRRRKAKSQIWESKIWSRVPRGSDPRKTALARTSSIYKRQTQTLVREGVRQRARP
jgi:hypothetical protein